MKKNKLFIDLDGTLLDVSDRLYHLYTDLLPESAVKLSKKEYIALKRSRISEKDILIHKKKAGQKTVVLSSAEIENYTNRRLQLIESEKYLRYDKVMPSVTEVLLALRKHYHLILLTSRKSEENLRKEISSFGLSDMFDEVIVISGKKKIEFVSGIDHSDAVAIGDTEDDISLKSLGLPVIAVSSGMRTQKYLKSLRPTLLCRGFASIKPSHIENAIHKTIHNG